MTYGVDLHLHPALKKKEKKKELKQQWNEWRMFSNRITQTIKFHQHRIEGGEGEVKTKTICW